MFNIGDFVFDTANGANVQVMERIELWGYTSYKVFNPANGSVYKATGEQLKMGGNEAQLDENYLRYVMLLSKIKNETSAGVLSSLSSGIIPLPHQLHVLDRALETRSIRYILADEVGLGKTIEAGMIIKELKTRGLIERILVVCPTGLVSQWSVEMQEKFHEKFQVSCHQISILYAALPITRMCMVNSIRSFPPWIPSSHWKNMPVGQTSGLKNIIKSA